VTLKSPSSVPPYRIENGCKDVQLYFIQLPLVARPDSKRYIDNLPPGEAMPYAWDEPTLRNQIRVQVGWGPGGDRESGGAMFEALREKTWLK
jgi:hypothetical protein